MANNKPILFLNSQELNNLNTEMLHIQPIS